MSLVKQAKPKSAKAGFGFFVPKNTIWMHASMPGYTFEMEVSNVFSEKSYGKNQN